MSSRQGYLYILFHESFAQYGQDVYKLGLSINPTQRMKSYTTPFLTNPKFLYTSSMFHDCHKAERVLFYVLQSQRLAKNREFFQIPLDRAKSIIQRLECLTRIQLDRLYNQVCLELVPYSVQMALFTGKTNIQDAYKKIQEEVDQLSHLEYDERLAKVFDMLERFRFRPKHPELYFRHGYTDPEKDLLNRLELKSKENTDPEDNDETCFVITVPKTELDNNS